MKKSKHLSMFAASNSIHDVCKPATNQNTPHATRNQSGYSGIASSWIHGGFLFYNQIILKK